MPETFLFGKILVFFILNIDILSYKHFTQLSQWEAKFAQHCTAVPSSTIIMQLWPWNVVPIPSILYSTLCTVA